MSQRAISSSPESLYALPLRTIARPCKKSAASKVRRSIRRWLICTAPSLINCRASLNDPANSNLTSAVSKLSELDLKLRGPGVIYGTLQHGKGFGRMLTLADSQLNELTDRAAGFFLENDRNLLKCKALAVRVQAVRQLTYLN